MPLAPTKRQPLDLDPAQPLDQALEQQALDQQALDQPALDPALGPPARPYLALLRDLPASSPLPTWTSPTSAAPPSMETPHLGAPPRLIPTMFMSVELAPGDPAMPPALFKRLLPPQQLLLLPQP